MINYKLHTVTFSADNRQVSLRGENSSLQTYGCDWNYCLETLAKYFKELEEDIYFFDFASISIDDAYRISVKGPMISADVPEGFRKPMFGENIPLDWSLEFGGATGFDYVNPNDKMKMFLSLNGATGAKISKKDIHNALMINNLI